MWYLYLDESGDLGFDFVNKKPSKFFTICILAIHGMDAHRQMSKAVQLTLRRKLNARRHRKRMVQELKGTGTTLEVKKYFYDRVKNLDFSIYAVTLDKYCVDTALTLDASHIYSVITRKALEYIPFPLDYTGHVTLTIDRSMSKSDMAKFNIDVRCQLESKFSSKVRLFIEHRLSHEYPGLQATDLFGWGIFQKYEQSKIDWFGVFALDKIKCDERCL